MGSFSLVHWIIVALVVLVLFGRGKISETMGDFGKGVKSFRKGLSEDDTPRAPPAEPTPLAPPTAPPAAQNEAPAEPVKAPEKREEQ